MILPANSLSFGATAARRRCRDVGSAVLIETEKVRPEKL
jgi:hypothetical protein